MRYLQSIGAVVILLVSATSSTADNCDPTFLQQHPGVGLWAFDAQARASGNSTPGAWLDVAKNSNLPLASVQKFAYVGRATPLMQDREGAISVKLLQVAGVDSPPVSSVLLRRSIPGSSCGFRRFVGLVALPLDFGMGQQVDVWEYIAYHASESRSNSTLQRFHINYGSQLDGCVSTDSSVKNRRTSFLLEYDGKPIPVSEEVVAAIRDYLGPGTAVAANAANQVKKTSFKLPSIVGREARAFKNFANVESQIHTYGLNGRVCVAFSQMNPAPNSAVRIDIVDLDDPMAPRRKHWMVNWR